MCSSPSTPSAPSTPACRQPLGARIPCSTLQRPELASRPRPERSWLQPPAGQRDGGGAGGGQCGWPVPHRRASRTRDSMLLPVSPRARPAGLRRVGDSRPAEAASPRRADAPGSRGTAGLAPAVWPAAARRPCSWAAAMPAALPKFFSPRAGGKAWRLPRGVTAPRGGLREPWLQTGALFCCFPRASLVLWPPGGGRGLRSQEKAEVLNGTRWLPWEKGCCGTKQRGLGGWGRGTQGGG